jgi:hypothetical protein
MHAPEEINPALRMAWRLQSRALIQVPTLDELLPMATAIQEAMEAGEKLQGETGAVLERLRSAEGVSADVVPVGF